MVITLGSHLKEQRKRLLGTNLKRHNSYTTCHLYLFSFNFQDLRKYEHIATLSNRNFSKVLEIAENASRCQRCGSVTQYTFKCIQKIMSEVKVYEKLCEILNGDAATKTRLKKTVGNVQVSTSSKLKGHCQGTTCIFCVLELICFSKSRKVPAEVSKVDVSETRIARRGSENNDVRMVVESYFTKMFMCITIRTVIIIFFRKRFRKMMKRISKDQ